MPCHDDEVSHKNKKEWQYSCQDDSLFETWKRYSSQLESNSLSWTNKESEYQEPPSAAVAEGRQWCISQPDIMKKEVGVD